MVSVGMSALGCTAMHVVDPGTKIIVDYYRNQLLKKDLLPEIRECSDYSVFQQDQAPAHRARETVAVSEPRDAGLHTAIASLWPPNSPDLNPVMGLRSGDCYRSGSTGHR